MTENTLRLGIFIASILIFAILEYRYPRQALKEKRLKRWTKNYAFVFIASLLIRFLIPLSATATAVYAEEHHLGLFNLLSFPFFVNLGISIILLDLAIYCQHLIFHRVPFLWRFHQVHHIDRSIDTSSALRFHPIEFILSMIIKMGIVTLLGAPWQAVVAFEILLNSMAIFNHANIKMSPHLDRLLRLMVVTPDMHRIHHSTSPNEFHRNFGFNLSCWDKLFNTYTKTPKIDHHIMPIGQPDFLDHKKNTLLSMLLHPFKPTK